MALVESYIYQSQSCTKPAYQPWTSSPAVSRTTDVAPIRVCENTTTLPSNLPHALVDAFDIDTELAKKIATPLSVFLSFNEFNGFAPRIPLLVQVEFIDGLFEIRHSELGLYGQGETSGKAYADFLQYLISDYKEYAEEPEENLDSNARALAQRYRQMLKAV